MSDRVGEILEMQETRMISSIRDADGRVLDLIPSKHVDIQLKLLLHLPNGQNLCFWVDVPPEVQHALEVVRGGDEEIAFEEVYPRTPPKSLQELTQQLENDLAGVEDDHDRAVKAAESYGSSYLERKAKVIADLADEEDRKVAREFKRLLDKPVKRKAKRKAKPKRSR